MFTMYLYDHRGITRYYVLDSDTREFFNVLGYIGFEHISEIIGYFETKMYKMSNEELQLSWIEDGTLIPIAEFNAIEYIVNIKDTHPEVFI